MPQSSPSPVAPGARPLDGVLVVALEQAVAAPYCSSRLADAGARVIKVERKEGDFARGYDRAVHGESSYWVWTNRGKESIALDLKDGADLALLARLLARADVFIQNLAPGATERLGIGSAALRERHPRLVTCDISGYGDDGRWVGLKAYDLLVQAESGLVSVSGPPGDWGRIGVSVCDVTAGLNALIGIQQALMQRERTGRGSAVRVSLFGSAAELMSVPYLQTRYGGTAPERVGLAHLARRPLATLSGGQAQRAFLARALAQEAHLILLDEALSGVDQPRTEGLLDLFTELARSGTSLLIATHDLSLARRRFGRCLAINRSLIGDGAPHTALDTDRIEATFGTPIGGSPR